MIVEGEDDRIVPFRGVGIGYGDRSHGSSRGVFIDSELSKETSLKSGWPILTHAIDSVAIGGTSFTTGGTRR